MKIVEDQFFLGKGQTVCLAPYGLCQSRCLRELRQALDLDFGAHQVSADDLPILIKSIQYARKDLKPPRAVTISQKAEILFYSKTCTRARVYKAPLKTKKATHF